MNKNLKEFVVNNITNSVNNSVSDSVDADDVWESVSDSFGIVRDIIMNRIWYVVWNSVSDVRTWKMVNKDAVLRGLSDE